ncbi:MAG TPA: phospholipase D-like domain-containing protein [Candidatus Saccharimonadales bacterium]|nr:phospholipase D-like domain-containing protein [Candidatus Saccharimonadales bacterium]
MNWFRKSKQKIPSTSVLATSMLYNEETFYNQFLKDLLKAKKEVIIESPYITKKRLTILKPVFEKLIEKGIQVFILTRNPQEHDEIMGKQAEIGIQYFESIGIQVLLVKGGHHRKLAMIDREVLWEGSLNILSQSNSREFMRRIESRQLTQELFQFLKFNRITEFNMNTDLL